jgi:putative redox protein
MTIKLVKDKNSARKHVVYVRNHQFSIDASAANGGADLGPDPHDLYDAALGACTALTVLWYANHKKIPVTGLELAVERDDSEEADGRYKLRTLLKVEGELDQAQRDTLLSVAGKCPVHKLMTKGTTEISTGWLED